MAMSLPELMANMSLGKKGAQDVANQYQAPPELGSEGNTRLFGWLLNRLFHGITNPEQTGAQAVATMMPGSEAEAFDTAMNISPMGMGPMPLATKQGVNWAKKAKKIFGETNNFRNAGYILPEGTLLDFSGFNQGAFLPPGGARYLDHRDIFQAMSGRGGGTEGMLKFIDNSDAARVSYDGSDMLLHLINKPTKQQLNALRYEFPQMNSIYIDIADKKGKITKATEIYNPKFNKVKTWLDEVFKK